MSRLAPREPGPRIARVLPLRRPGAERAGLGVERAGLGAERAGLGAERAGLGVDGPDPLTGLHERSAGVTSAAPRPQRSDAWAIAAGSGEAHDTRTIQIDARALAQMLAGRSPESAAVTRTYDVPPELLATLLRSTEGCGARGRDVLRPLGAAGGSRLRRAPTAVAATDLGRPAIGSLVAGKYRVVSHLDRGGSATISLAAFRGAAGVYKLVVLKCPGRAPEVRNASRAALLDEARLAARMNHPHVIQVYDVAEHEGLPVLVMEYLDGRSLASVMTAARDMPELDRSLKLDIVARVLAGLHYAHGLCDLSGRPLHVVHRDVSPHNVVLTCEGQVKLIDFGIAQCGAPARPTAAKRVVGKLGYMAPEQLRGAADRRADVFAAGVVLWELMTARRFWDRATQAEVMRRLLDLDIPRVASLQSDLDDEIASICRRALAPDPAARYATAAQMQADVERALENRSASAADRAIGQLICRIHAGERRARQRDLQQALGELDLAGHSPKAPAVGAAGPVVRARLQRSGRRAVALLAALLALQWGDAAPRQDSGAAPWPEPPSPVGTAPARVRADAREPAPAPPVVASTPSTSKRPLGNADGPRALPPVERAASSRPAAAPRPPLPAPRRSGRTRLSRGASRQQRPAPAGPAPALVTQLQPGVDLNGLRHAPRALPAAKGGAR